MNNIEQKTTDDKHIPNIFNYATSELSQDAFILWLLDWANPEFEKEDKALCDTAQNFVRLLLKNEKLQITSVKCKKQEKHIDVFAIINEKYALIVEDKTNTSEHDNQIHRYYEWVKNEKKYSNLEIHCVYYKTGNESAFKLERLSLIYDEEFKSEHFSILTREEVLELFKCCSSQNAIFIDYVAHIQSIQDATDAYLTTPIKQWNWLAWQGFYLRLEKELGTGDWGYVANPSGGFWGFWWHWCQTTDPNIEVYLQFEKDKLCIKAYHKGNGKIDIKYSNKLKKAAIERNIALDNKAKRRTGKTMTLAVVKLQNFDMLNMPDLLRQLKEIESFLDIVSKEL
jgi:hypothetical protein